MTEKIKRISETKVASDVDYIDLADDLKTILMEEDGWCKKIPFIGEEMTWEQLRCNIPYEAEVKRRVKNCIKNNFTKIKHPFTKIKNNFYKYIFENYFDTNRPSLRWQKSIQKKRDLENKLYIEKLKAMCNTDHE